MNETASSAEAALRVLIVDDEEPARWRLRSLVEGCPAPHAVVVAEAAGAAEALAWLDGPPGQAQAQACDVMLLDIAMPGLSGLALAAQLRAPGRPAPAIVFVTAHAEHALQAFELAATDYLTKPVRRERLQAALQRVAEQRLLRPAATPGTAPTAAEDESPVLLVSDRQRIVRVPVTEVLYLKAELKYVTVRTTTRSLLMDDSLSELEARLGAGFLRIHRNALVARRAVRALERRTASGDDDEPGEGWALRLDGVDEWLAVSRRQLPAVREALLAVDAGGKAP